MKDQLSPKALAVKTAYALIHLPEKERIFVMEKFYGSIHEEKRKRMHDLSYEHAYPKRKTKIEMWMESTFAGNMGLKPIVVAHKCVNHFRIKKTMLPFYIRLAQKIKRRISCRDIMRRKKFGKRMVDVNGY